jgi:acyl dehydratase
MDYAAVRAREFLVRQSFSARDVVLYALGVGYGYDPTDESQLRFVLEPHPWVVPTFASVLAHPGPWMAAEDSTIDYTHVVHGQQVTTFHNPLPPDGSVVGRTRVAAIVDKGQGRGAVVYQERTIEDYRGTLLATAMQAMFCRGDGGLNSSDPEPEALPPVPESRPDEACELNTALQAALIYRLSGDHNPLHVDPAAAALAGFPRPILHGLSTYGVAGHAVLRTVCDYDTSRLLSIGCRFSAPVFPGDAIKTELWIRGSRVHFRSVVEARSAVVLDRGVAEVAAQ